MIKKDNIVLFQQVRKLGKNQRCIWFFYSKELSTYSKFVYYYKTTNVFGLPEIVKKLKCGRGLCITVGEVEMKDLENRCLVYPEYINLNAEQLNVDNWK